MPILILILLLAALLSSGPDAVRAAEPVAVRTQLVEAILTDDAGRQAEVLRQLVTAPDPLVRQVLTAWRGGELQIFETNGVRIPVLLGAQSDGEGRSQILQVTDGSPVRDGSGQPLMLTVAELTAADAGSKLRRMIKTTLDLFALSDRDAKMRRDAVIKLGQEQNAEYLPYFEARVPIESDPEVGRVLREAIALTQMADENPEIRVAAIRRLAELRSINSLSFLQKLAVDAKADPGRYGAPTMAAVSAAIVTIDNYIRVGNLFGTAFRGLSLAAVLLVAALGLAITFGLMGVINMAHGELIMVGAYATYVVQNVFQQWKGGFELYFPVALVVSFVAAGAVGLVLERGVIRFLYRRPLESLLATWGVSLVLQQMFRDIFGAANVQVASPRWLSGSLVLWDVLLAYNRMFVIGFAAFTILLTWWLLVRTSLGLQIRAVMQNRTMASALGVRTDRVNMMTFAFGSGLAGMAGACLSQIGNVGPSLGQNYIIDCFMVVVLGGVGNLPGTLSAALGVGVADQILQPWLGAVMGKITVLAAIILFLQWRPAGLFVTRTRSLEG